MTTELVIDGKKVPMNEFVGKVFSNVTEALIECLHGIDENWEEVTIKINREK